MKSVISISILTLCSACAINAQDQSGLKKKSHVVITVAPGPVTRAEASETFRKVADVYQSIFHIQVPRSVKGVPSNAPISRSEIITAFAQLYHAAEPAFRITPKPVAVDLPRLKIDSPSLRPSVIMLLERGCMAPYGSLVTGPARTISVHDFGDAVGYFLARIGEMTHTPSSKWTPYLRGGQ